MSNTANKFMNQTMYFKVAFLVTIIPVAVFLGYGLYVVLIDVKGMLSNETDAGLAAFIYLPLIIVMAAVYYVILRLCARKSYVGKVASLIVIALTLFAVTIKVATLTSGA